MNPQGALGAGFARSISNNTNSNGGFTIGNIDQSQITAKQNNAQTKTNNATDRSDVITHDTPRESHAMETTNQIEALPHSNKLIHIEQDDFNVRRSNLPRAHAHHKRSLEKRRGKKFKRHSRPRPPCSDISTATKKSELDGGDRFDVLGDFNEIMEKSVKRKHSSDRRRKTRRRSIHERRSTGDTRRAGELYNIHDGVLNPVMESRSCIFTPVEKNKKSSIHELSSVRDVRSEADEVDALAKKSGIKTMKIHNELGGMHIKSDPSQTAVTSESGNIEITMLNDQGPSAAAAAAKKDEKAEVRNILLTSSGSSDRYKTASSRTLPFKMHPRPKARLYLANDESIRRHGIAVHQNGRLVFVQ